MIHGEQGRLLSENEPDLGALWRAAREHFPFAPASYVFVDVQLRMTRDSHPSAEAELRDPCAALRRASRAVTHLYDLVLSPSGLKITQFIMLRAIAESGEIAQWRLADQYGIAVETLSRRLATLRKSGLVTHRIGVTRPGERLYKVTPLGWQKLKEAIPYVTRAQERLAMVLGEENWNAALNLAGQIAVASRNAESARLSNRAPEKALAAAATTSSV